MDFKGQLASIRFSNSFKREVSKETESEMAALERKIAEVQLQIEQVGEKLGNAASKHDKDVREAWGVDE